MTIGFFFFWGGGGGGSCCYLHSAEPLSAGDVITQHHKEANPVFLEHFIIQTKDFNDMLFHAQW